MRLIPRAAAAMVLAAATTGSWATDAPTALVPPGESFYATSYEKTPSVAQLTQLGRRAFFDASLSASGRVSCASCHDPRYAYGPPGDGSTPFAGPDGRQRGYRATPSLRYLQGVPPFTEHMHDSDDDDSIDQGPAGGRTWDGRAQSTHEQASLPLLSPVEMANQSPEEVVARLRRAELAGAFKEAFGEHVLDNSRRAFNALLWSLEVFQQSPSDFYPYSSRYDAYLRGQGRLTEQEKRGLAAFDDPTRGNCASCHPSALRRGAFPAFTDFGYVALGVPRNRALAANRDAHFFDLGLCGPARRDLASRTDYCGLFRTPSLRNVATRRSFFHNGAFHQLERVLDFYAERDARPGLWYPRDANGRVLVFDDLPVAYRANVQRDRPFGQRAGGTPALTRAERADIVAFLRTLTDGDQTDRSDAHNRPAH
ncbi:MAG TPA: cytochrome c peroxidase [Casimicrobiaceae bacterium]|nr:cytochrome c peroxidase [Casimicrobiaceae bacterium]